LSSFLAGIATAQLAFFGPTSPSTVTDDILRERGWTHPNALAPWAEMEEHHYDFQQNSRFCLNVQASTPSHDRPRFVSELLFCLQTMAPYPVR
jgi:hypothetical protein